MQLFILLTGVMVFVFYQLHSSPLFFNKPIEDRVLATSYASDYKEKQAVFDGILQSKQALTASLTSADFQSEDIKSRMVAFNEQELKVRNEAKEVIRQALPDAETNDRDYVFLHFVLNYLPVGLIGLLLAVVFSATMSSTSAELTALASTSTIDWFQRLNKNTLSGEQVIFYTRAFTLLWGIFAIAFAMYGSMFENLIQFVNLIGSLFYGTILGVFLCAFYLKYLHGSAVFIAAIISEIVVITLYNITDIGFLWFNLIGCGLVVSLASIWTAGRSLVKA